MPDLHHAGPSSLVTLCLICAPRGAAVVQPRHVGGFHQSLWSCRLTEGLKADTFPLLSAFTAPLLPVTMAVRLRIQQDKGCEESRQSSGHSTWTECELCGNPALCVAMQQVHISWLVSHFLCPECLLYLQKQPFNSSFMSTIYFKVDRH